MTQVVVGRIVRPHGVRGHVVVDVRTDEPERRFQPDTVFHSAKGNLTASEVRWHQGRPMLKLLGVNDRNAAEELRGVELSMDLGEADYDLDEDEFRDQDLIGLLVCDYGPDGEAEEPNEVGTVSRVDHAPAHDLLVVKRRGSSPALIPFVADMVDEIDLEAEVIRVSLPEGLLEL
ncbi:ribosome maturation factor RimM [Natronoglycomyces albus]|uniref:Ribosome maturation factor RimM n=1 Tax=Natronoglycomyces albus TaxID=2811108 RepID=A0A895XM68_9ACTN|nr:ribosome maturation factor RimM [Natronoglycomyces albus]QSB06207.1 ribosome maturation factor RimM [Natronoglycomyces albus]